MGKKEVKSITKTKVLIFDDETIIKTVKVFKELVQVSGTKEVTTDKAKRTSTAERKLVTQIEIKKYEYLDSILINRREFNYNAEKQEKELIKETVTSKKSTLGNLDSDETIEETAVTE